MCKYIATYIPILYIHTYISDIVLSNTQIPEPRDMKTPRLIPILTDATLLENVHW
jgi:hypothetical protein